MGISKAIRSFAAAFREPEITTLELRDALDNPAIPISSAGLYAAMSGGAPTAAGEVITLDTALQESTVYACARVIYESVAALRLRVYELLDKGRREAPDSDLAYLVGVEPNEETAAEPFWEAFVGSLCLTGNGYAEIQRDNGGRPVGLWNLHPNLTTPVRLPNGSLVYETSDGMTGPGQVRRIAPENMLHCPLFCFDGVKGYSPIHLARLAIGLSRAAEKFGARFFGNGSRPGGVLSTTTELDDDAQRATKESWLQAQSGDKQGTTAFLYGDWKYTPITISPEDSQFIQVRQFQRTTICSWFRVPPHMVGDTQKLTNANAEQFNIQFVTDTLRPYLNRIETEIKRKLLPKAGRNTGRFIVEFDVSERLRGDFATTMKGYADGRQWGWLNGNEIRSEMGLNPGPEELDVYWVPVNMQNAARLLDTESIQDQPIDQPALPAPTSEERNLLGKYRLGYLRVYRDAFGRLLAREKRDSGIISTLFSPVLHSIAELSASSYGAEISPEDSGTASVVKDVLAAFEKRVAKLPEKLTDEETEALVAAEFTRAVRSIHINVTREVAAAKAAAALAEQAA